MSSNSLGKRVAFGLKDDLMLEAVQAQKIDRCEDEDEEVIQSIENSVARLENLVEKWKAIANHIREERKGFCIA